MPIVPVTGRIKGPRCESQRAFARLRAAERLSADEKRSLLEAIKEYGLLDVERLVEAVPKRSIVEVRNYLARRKIEGLWKSPSKSISSKSEPPPLEQWLEALTLEGQWPQKRNISTSITQALYLIAEGEKHPSPEQCGGVNFKNLYYHLAQLLDGTRPRDVDGPSARLLMECYVWMTSMMMNKDTDRERTYIGHRHFRLPSSGLPLFKKSYSKKEQEIAKRDGVLQHVDLNPLHVPRDMLQQVRPEELATLGEPGYSIFRRFATGN